MFDDVRARYRFYFQIRAGFYLLFVGVRLGIDVGLLMEAGVEVNVIVDMNRLKVAAAGFDCRV
jgi:hypothetical protein